MRVARVFFSIFFAVNFSFPLPAQQSPPAVDTAQPAVTRDAQALALLAQCNAAMGSSSIQDTSATGTLTTDDPAVPPATITTQTKGTAERFDTSSRDQTFVLNGSGSWAVRDGKRARVPYALSAFHRPEQVPALACVLDIAKPNLSFVYVGLETLNGRASHHIKVFIPSPANDKTDSILSELNLFLDAQSFVVVRTERFVFDPFALENRSVWATSYSDYRQVGPGLMPFHIENYLDGHKVRDITFTSVQLNVGISDAPFQNSQSQPQ